MNDKMSQWFSELNLNHNKLIYYSRINVGNKKLPIFSEKLNSVQEIKES